MANYNDQVRAAAAALQRGEDANWELARLTYEVCGPAGPRGRDTTWVRLDDWVADVRVKSGRQFSKMTASYYREIWQRFGVRQGVPQISWSDAYAEIRGGTVGERMVEADFKRALTNATPEQKREVLTTLACEPEVLADDQTRWAVQFATNRATRARYPELERPAPTPVEPADSTLDRRIFLADIAHKIDQWTRELDGIRDFLDWSGDVDQQRRWATRQAIERLIVAATACRDVLPDSYVELVDSA